MSIPDQAQLAEQAGAVLSPRLIDLARSYVEARRRNGESLLSMAATIAAARQQAEHGQWLTWLEATQTNDRAARRLLAINERASADPAFADAVRNNWFNATVAALVAEQSDDRLLAELLALPGPPSARQASAAIKAAALPLLPAHELQKHAEEQAQAQAPAQVEPAATIARIEAHGWQKIAQRQRGAERVFEFRNMRSPEREIQIMLEAELAAWAADLDRAAEQKRADIAAAERCRQNIGKMKTQMASMPWHRAEAIKDAEAIEDAERRATWLRAVELAEVEVKAAIEALGKKSEAAIALENLRNMGWLVEQIGAGWVARREGYRPIVTDTPVQLFRLAGRAEPAQAPAEPAEEAQAEQQPVKEAWIDLDGPAQAQPAQVEAWAPPALAPAEPGPYGRLDRISGLCEQIYASELAQHQSTFAAIAWRQLGLALAPAEYAGQVTFLLLALPEHALFALAGLLELPGAFSASTPLAELAQQIAGACAALREEVEA